MSREKLYPPLKPYNTGFLSVSKIHTIYYEEVGDSNGLPVLFYHGGPGGGLLDIYRQFFDPSFYRVILFNQRGAGNSKPHAELQENTTWDLVKDSEKIRKHLKIESWLIFGGSWGSTMAFAYTIKHPTRVKGLILRGIFLCRKSEIKWFYQEGASNIFPEEWDKYLAVIPKDEQQDMVSAYYKRLTSEDSTIRLKAAFAWSRWEAATSKLHVSKKSLERFEDPKKALAFARIECHYFINEIFMPSDNYLLKEIKKLKDIPCRIVQGRYDVVCPISTAWEVKKAMNLPDSEFRVIQDAGHSITEDGILLELLQATEDFKSLLIT